MEERLDFDILDQLVNDHESFAIIHTDLVRVYGHKNLDVDVFLRTLWHMLDEGWIRSKNPPSPSKADWEKSRRAYLRWLRLPSGKVQVPRGQGYFEDMGPWLEVTEKGRKRWQRLVAEHQHQ